MTKVQYDSARPFPLMMSDDKLHIRTAAEEVKARGAELFIITDNKKLAVGLDPNPIVIPSNGELTSLIGVLPLQLIAYELAILKGINPDTPRSVLCAVYVMARVRVRVSTIRT